MPYKDPAAQREYQRQWAAARRAQYLAGMCCVDCGSTDRLEVDHVNPDDKVSHRIWTWSHKRIREELAKCVFRCQACHIARHQAENRKHGHGEYRRGCRCDVCVAANRKKNVRYRERCRERATVRTDAQGVPVLFDLKDAA